MNSARRFIRRAFFTISVLTPGCGGEQSEPSGNGDPPAAAPCEDSTADAFSVPLTKTSGSGLNVTLVSSDPAPPVIGDNTWVLKVTDATGTPLSGVTLLVEPFMPEHGHFANRDAIVTDNGDGTYEVERVNFMMAGAWEARTSVTTAEGTDKVVFTFCFD